MKVLVTKDKLDSLAATISVKAGVSLPLSIDEMASAVQSIQNSGATVALQAKTVTPSSSQFTVTADSGYNGLSSVTVAAITPTYVGNSVTRGNSNSLTVSGATVCVPAGYYATPASKTIANATYSTQFEQTISGNQVKTIHSINDWQAGYVTTLSIPAAEQDIIEWTITPSLTTQRLTQTDPSVFLASVIVDPIPSSGIEVPSTTQQTQINTKTKTLTASAASIQFTGLEAEPTSFIIISKANLSTGASPYKTATVLYDGTNIHGQYITNTSNAQVTYNDSAFSKSYSNGTLTVTGTNTNFQANAYDLIYSYGGTPTNDIDTKDIQVGSGATSITFTGLNGEPSYFSCIFKSNFSTSSGYQRVISIVYDGTSTYGLAMGSGAIAASSWTYTYNNGTLTLTSQGTNAGGYFHQPGYYQLTYALGASGKGQTMLVTPSIAQQVVRADEGHTLDTVIVDNIPTSYVIPSGTLTITSGMSGMINVATYAYISL